MTVSAQTTESTGPGGYGWQQAYTTASPYVRVTGSSDRQFYDWGYKNVSISGRKEQYFMANCGWWYVSQESTLNITFTDAAGDYFVINETATTVKGQTGSQDYAWSIDDDDPGRWNVTVKDDGNVTVSFYVYVRGQLFPSGITAGSPEAGTQATVTVAISDNANNVINGSATDNTGTSVVPTVTAYITGPGTTANLTMYDDGATSGDSTANDGTWTTQFTPSRPGDHLVIIRATDDHTYWVDGRGSATIKVSGTFPYSFIGAGPSAVAKVIAMILLGYFLLRPGRRVAAMAVLILFGLRL